MGGYGEMVVERVGERKKRRGGMGVRTILYPAYLPKLDSSRTFLLNTLRCHGPMIRTNKYPYHWDL